VKIGKYFIFVLLIIEGLGFIFPKFTRPFFDMGLGIITVGRFLGLLTIGMVFWILVRKEEL
jgi:hypothetical protein